MSTYTFNIYDPDNNPLFNASGAAALEIALAVNSPCAATITFSRKKVPEHKLFEDGVVEIYRTPIGGTAYKEGNKAWYIEQKTVSYTHSPSPRD